jgi:hypothetical protein
MHPKHRSFAANNISRTSALQTQNRAATEAVELQNTALDDLRESCSTFVEAQGESDNLRRYLTGFRDRRNARSP